jgi:hypothetical protein
MFEIWFVEKSLRTDQKIAKPIGCHQTDDGSPERYHNLETAKRQARIVQDHPAFKSSATVYVYDVAKDRFLNIK